jgi:hypothetical protein
MGKPVTLDIGVGPFKTRVIGPPVKEEGDESDVKGDDFSGVGPLGLVAVVLSGTVKLMGQIVGVRQRKIVFICYRIVPSLFNPVCP